MTYRVISAEDGHFTRGEFAFRVAGKRDCAADEIGTPGPRATFGDGAAADDRTPPTEPGGVPVVPVLLGGGAILVLAVAVRLFSSR